MDEFEYDLEFPYKKPGLPDGIDEWHEYVFHKYSDAQETESPNPFDDYGTIGCRKVLKPTKSNKSVARKNKDRV